ncbi:class I SAM-dependent methyltransferase [Streptomyces sp. SKN60]|uniref:class I SAM-dependent DNA methyltransferase n=1 Tax=Streptomyces sp. SKN60 TaxID=2855506 RepID=UPI0022485327|nr:class I SAM-dependent methyltransferase [Streptomyces sp. SKN60]
MDDNTLDAEQNWLADTRTSYDTVAADYADLVRGLLDRTPYERAMLALFADAVRASGGGPVADLGCGPGRITAHLGGLGLDVLGIDLSPAMIDVARREHPGTDFRVGSMTELDLPDGSMGGLVAWYSLIHVPDAELDRTLAHFHRALRPGGPLLLAFHAGDETRLKTEGYGGHPLRLHVHLREPEQLAGRLAAAGFAVEARMTLTSAESALGALVVARRAAA